MKSGKVEFFKNIQKDQMGETHTLYVDDSCNFYIYKNPNFLSKSDLCFCKFTSTAQTINTIKNILIFDKTSEINNSKTLNCEILNNDSIFKIKSEFFYTKWKITFFPGKIKFTENKNYNINFALYILQENIKKKISESKFINLYGEYDSGIFVEYIKVKGSTSIQLEVNSNTDNSCMLENSYIIFEQIQ